jgi:hypothetical protein
MLLASKACGDLGVYSVAVDQTHTVYPILDDGNDLTVPRIVRTGSDSIVMSVWLAKAAAILAGP